ncbi:flagellar assembly protein T N-terminal domain-containing protein [uncultured Lamprocystis sp.]|jgi:hypothetical protein|uniref:flagellar assembly protein T N-terminal domain-containing protein n=1 Tax=uncultured Lamprocystis sp. TaxID=543132 RepID=UPI0025DA7E7A|nr:flagellar assembly protein T N-terminal domain-containing protein [uncultured Lamprocystis sp.]
MTSRRALTLAVLLIGALFIVPVIAQTEAPTAGVKVVTCAGEALIDGADLPAARQRALQEAFAAALTQTLGAYLSAESFTRNFESIERGVYHRTAGYIKTYSVLDETSKDGVLEVRIEAQVSTGPLKDDLTAMGILLDAVGNPVVAVQGQDQGVDPPASVLRFREEFARQGLRLADSAEPSDVLLRLRGQVQSSNALGGVGLHGVVVALAAEAVKPADNRAILSAAESANGAGLNETAALADGYAKAADRLFPIVLERLTRAWQAEVNTGRLIPVQVRVADLPALIRFKQRLARVFGVDKVELKQFQPGLGELLVRFRGAPAQLAELTGMTQFLGQAVAVQSVNAAGLVVAVQ